VPVSDVPVEILESTIAGNTGGFEGGLFSASGGVPVLRNVTIAHYQHLARTGVLPRSPQRSLQGTWREVVTALKTEYGIDFRAPADARRTEIASGSINCITSSNTLEHIPAPDIAAIVQECHRILADDGLMSFQIDYQDHYAYVDRHISVYNFLQYSESTWRWCSPRLHYQNRLRHRDYLQLFEQGGFEVVTARHGEITPKDMQKLANLSLHPTYRAYSLPELAVRGAQVILRKRPRL
jgi:SAM-dependent methyltransferase